MMTRLERAALSACVLVACFACPLFWAEVFIEEPIAVIAFTFICAGFNILAATFYYDHKTTRSEKERKENHEHEEDRH